MEDMNIFIDEYQPIDYSAEYPKSVRKLFSRQMNSTTNPAVKRLRPEFGWIYRLCRDSRITDIRYDIEDAKKWRFFTVKVADSYGVHWQTCRKRDYCLERGYIILRHTDEATDRMISSRIGERMVSHGYTEADLCDSQIFEVAPGVYDAIHTYRLLLKI